MKCEHVSPRVYVALTVSLTLNSKLGIGAFIILSLVSSERILHDWPAIKSIKTISKSNIILLTQSLTKLANMTRSNNRAEGIVHREAFAVVDCSPPE